MAYKHIKRTYGVDGKPIDEFVMDSAADLASLPKSNPTSTAYTAESGMKLFMVNASGEWKEL